MKMMKIVRNDASLSRDKKSNEALNNNKKKE